ncbi:hypothetical protein [Geobacter pickeringii]|uniref:Uncharacterized protein n=1 Tax=Geobacter pickeringii TaxID=345632 RepID=A0A0B5BC17_9BACT|nr:hypothetical protein [Geobacter pickeringii]AJE04072.1 hypothetical protein GPICK_12520 [Geobacter pickeringii]
MPDNPPLQENPIRRVDQLWTMVLPVATLIMETVRSFWDTPPPDLAGVSSGSDRALYSFAQFVVAILLGLMVLPMTKWCCRRVHAWFWGKVAALALVLAVVAFFSYQRLLAGWTVRHGTAVLYVGTEVRPEVKEFVRKNPDMGTAELLENAGWQPARIWTEHSLLHRRLVLAGVYILCTPLFAAAIMAVAQLMYCAGARE